MKGFGAMISFEVKGGLESAIKFVDGLKLAQLAVSLGDCETLVQIPAAITHRGYPEKRLAEFGLTESMVRISVGLEDSKDIIEDLEEGFKFILKTVRIKSYCFIIKNRNKLITIIIFVKSIKME